MKNIDWRDLIFESGDFEFDLIQNNKHREVILVTIEDGMELLKVRNNRKGVI